MNGNSAFSSGKRKKIQTYPCECCGSAIKQDIAKCSSCGTWNTPKVQDDGKDQTILLSEVSPNPIKYIKTGGAWDKCFSQEGGIATVSVTLIGGAPGAGKSTMALQLSDKICQITKKEIIYIGTEETAQQIKARASRLGVINMDRIRIFPMGANSDLGGILLSRKPCAVILDSLPGLTNDPEQAVELCKRFKEYAVELNAPIIIIDHVTKDDDFAGLMQLQHAVDTTITIFPDKHGTRQMTTIKNRFGPANFSIEMEMTEKGLIEGEEFDEETDEDWVDD